MENENNEKKNQKLTNQENKTLKNLDENNEPIVKDKNNIKNNENNDVEVKTTTKIKINELLNKDKKLKEIFQLINSPINYIKKRNIDLSKDKIQNFLNDSSYYESSGKKEKNSTSKNKNKYKEVYDQINIIDSLNETKKDKPLIPYSDFKVKTIKFQPVKKVKNLNNYKSFSNKNKKKNDIFSGLMLPEKKEWITNTLFKSTNIFKNQKKDF